MTRVVVGIAPFLFVAASLCVAAASAQQVTGTLGSPSATTTLQGNQLPPPPPKFGGVIKESAADSKTWWPPRVVPPKGAPNVLLIMTDDQGYGVSGTFGGVIPTPALDRVAKAGLRYTQFNSTALCSPTRAALITGRNHHAVGFGVISELSTGFPGYDSIIGPQNATIGRILGDNGMRHPGSARITTRRASSTASRAPSTSGHRAWASSISTASWAARPTSGRPTCSSDHTQIFPWIGKPGYNLTTDMADEAITHMRNLNAAAPDQPFFVYYVPGGSHSPHQPTKEWIEKFKGKFDMGWEKMREQIFANQKRLGVIPANAKLTPWPADLPKWESLSILQKKLYARQAEVYAALHRLHRPRDRPRHPGGCRTWASSTTRSSSTSTATTVPAPKGTLSGTFNQFTAYNGILDVPEPLQLLHLRGVGLVRRPTRTWRSRGRGRSTPRSSGPSRWRRTSAARGRGWRFRGPVISRTPGGVRHQFHHVIDIVPTILEATGIKAPDHGRRHQAESDRGCEHGVHVRLGQCQRGVDTQDPVFRDDLQPRIYNDGWYANTHAASGAVGS